MSDVKSDTNKLKWLSIVGLFIAGIFLIATIYWIYLILSQPWFWYMTCATACLGIAGYGCYVSFTYEPNKLRQKRGQIVLIVTGLIVGSMSSFGIGHWLDNEKPDAKIASLPSQIQSTDTAIVSPEVNSAEHNSSSVDQENQKDQRNLAPIVANTEKPKIIGQSPAEAETQQASASSAVTADPTSESSDPFASNVALFAELMAQNECSNINSVLEPSRIEFERTINSLVKPGDLGLGQGYLATSKEGVNCYIYHPCSRLAVILTTRAEDERLVHIALYFCGDGSKRSAINSLTFDMATIGFLDPTLSLTDATTLLAKLHKATIGGSKSVKLHGVTYLFTKMDDKHTLILEMFVS